MNKPNTAQGRVDTPVVSLIVPMYNVQQYLADCLDSVLSQDLSPIQVILVDDGSTDGTAAVALRYANAHPQVEYHRIENQGLGHARNYGATFAQGEWLMFPDSDDELAPHALRDLVALGQKHTCDIVTGDVDRFNATRTWPNPLHRTALSGVPEVCHITTHPSLLYDHTAWNKLFRRTFFECAHMAWVEGHLYEDMPCATPAHCLASSVAHLDQVVYRWRERDGGGPSITQRRTEPANFRDRMHAIHLVDEFFERHELPDSLLLAKDAKWLTLDIPIYLDVLPEGDEAFRREVVETVAHYLERIDPRAWEMASSAERIKCRLAQKRDVESLVRFVRWQREAGDTLQAKRIRGRLRGSYPVAGITDSDLDMTKELTRKGLYTDVKSVSLANDTLEIQASALVPQLSQRHPSLSACLIRDDGKASIDLNVRPLKSGKPLEIRANPAQRTFAVKWQPQRDWTISSTGSSLAELMPGNYPIELLWSDDGLACKPIRLAHPISGYGPRPIPVRIGETLFAACYGAGEELMLRVRANTNPVSSITITDGVMYITMLDNSEKKISLPLRDSARPPRLELEDVPYAGKPILLPDSGDCKGDEALWMVSPSSNGSLLASVIPPSVQLVSCAVHGDAFVFRLSWLYKTPAPASVSAALVGNEFSAKTELGTVSLEEGTWTTTIDLSNPTIVSLLRDDTYHLLLEAGKGETFEVVCILDGGVSALHVAHHTYYVDTIGPKPLIRVVHDRTWDEGRLRQLAIERVAYPIMRRLPLQRELVLFESFWATSIGCSPKALYDFIDKEHPEYRCVWSVRDVRIPVGGNGKVVRQGGFGYYHALACASHLISNVNFPDYYVKRKGQVEVQTMHGTPLKTMGIDVRDEVPNEEAAARFLSTCSRWDYLVVQSRRVEEITRHCFGFHKTYLRTGYPRNDSLLQRNTLDVQRTLKILMGADPGKLLVLYAPTWRVRGRFDLELDFTKLEKSLGNTYQFALRRHYMAVPLMAGNERIGNTIDLTYGWSVDDCMLAADVVVTDYSSIMFDYALLNRPIFFYCYDLESYRDELRGLYVDFEREAPGPILNTTDEVVSALSDLEGVRRQYKKRYDNFVETYLEYETDHSSKDVFEQVFN